MRAVLALAALAIVAVGGCGASGVGASGAVTPSAEAHGTRASTPSLEPHVAQSCRDAQDVNNQATAKFTASLAQAVTAGEQGNTATQQAAMVALRETFRDWSAALRAQADKTGDARLKAALIEYAGAVDATILRVKSADDLQVLDTFDDHELDLAANKLSDVCR